MADHDLPPSPERHLADLARSHLGLVVSGAIFTWVVIRVLSASWFQQATAAAIISSGNPVGIALGTLRSIVPVAISVISFWWFIEPRRLTSRKLAANIGALLLLIVIVAVTAPVNFLAGVVAGVLTAFATKPLVKRAGSPPSILVEQAFTNPGFVPMGILLVFGLWASLIGGVWLPAEVLVLRGEPPLTGYVISESEGWTSVLVDETRQVIRLHSATVIERHVCEAPGQRLDRTLLQMTTGGPETPDCRSLVDP